jgi:hypothetical protein
MNFNDYISAIAQCKLPSYGLTKFDILFFFSDIRFHTSDYFFSRGTLNKPKPVDYVRLALVR